MGSKISLGLVAALTACAVMAGSANAAATIQSSPNPGDYTFLPGPYVQGLGESASFDNSASLTYHDVTANQNGPDGEPLFYAPVIAGGQTEIVQGTEYLKPGSYPFYCTLHGPSMSGVLEIDGSEGKAVPRPSVKVSLPARKLKQIRKSGVKVKVKASTASRNVTLVVTKGKVRLGVKKKLNFRAGQTKTVTIRLTKAGRKAVRKGKAVKIKVKASVAFGKPSTATRKFR